MFKEYYSTKVVELCGQVADFIAAAKMINLFETEMSKNLPELRDTCVLHEGNKLDDTVKPGDIFKLAVLSSKSSKSAAKSRRI